MSGKTFVAIIEENSSRTAVHANACDGGPGRRASWIADSHPNYLTNDAGPERPGHCERDSHSKRISSERQHPLYH